MIGVSIWKGIRDISKKDSVGIFCRKDGDFAFPNMVKVIRAVYRSNDGSSIFDIKNGQLERSYKYSMPATDRDLLPTFIQAMTTLGQLGKIREAAATGNRDNRDNRDNRGNRRDRGSAPDGRDGGDRPPIIYYHCRCPGHYKT